MSGFVLHPDAYTDLDEIWEYIAADSLDAADRIREEIFEAIRSLVAFPYTGHDRPDLTARPLRFQSLRDYVIAYAPDEKPHRRNRGAPRTPQSTRDRSHTQAKGLSHRPKRKRPRSFLNVAFI